VAVLRNLHQFNGADTAITDAGLAHLSDCTSLRVLDLRNCPKISDSGLMHLKTLVDLEFLYVEGTAVTDVGVNRMRDVLAFCEIDYTVDLLMEALFRHDDDLNAALAEVANVETDGSGRVIGVEMKIAEMTDRGLARLAAGLPELRSLAVRHARFSGAGISKLRRLKHLTALDLSRSQLTHDGPAEIARLTGLTRLALEGTTIDRETAVEQIMAAAFVRSTLAPGVMPGAATTVGLISLAAARAGGLQARIFAGGSRITDDEVALLAPLVHLNFLELADCDVSNRALGWLSTFKQLRRLGLVGTDVTPAAALRFWAEQPESSVQFTLGTIENRVLRLARDAGDDVLRSLDRIDALTGIDLRDTAISDGGLEHLAGHKNLRRLILSGTAVTDAGMRHLASLSELETLWLVDTAVGDDGLEQIESATKLTDLLLIGTPTTDAGLRRLQGMTKLRRLGLSETRITDDGLASLAAMGDLRDLAIDFTPVTDQGLVYLIRLQELRFLDLSLTDVTDAGIESLAILTKLSRLGLVSTGVSTDGVVRLQEQLPKCTIRARLGG
jgi:Leucine-rich repeat (LRR) protein